MTRTYAQIQKQIEKLQQEATTLRHKEVQGVIGRIKEAIAHYGLTVDDLFGARAAAPKAPKKRASNGKKPSVPKYRDEAGNTWTGRGKRPNWFLQALATGKTAQDLLIR
jgi:DNA-binding protein H-NS